jgi:hypothetical protein
MPESKSKHRSTLGEIFLEQGVKQIFWGDLKMFGGFQMFWGAFELNILGFWNV